MDLIDAIIIYLAFGAPFGAYHYISRARSGPAALAVSGFVAAAWILYLPVEFHIRIESMLNISRASEIERSRRVNRIASTLSASPRKTAPCVNVFEVRELVERYAGLSEALSEAEKGSGVQKDFWSAAGSPAPGDAAAIHSRQNLLKLKLHRTDSAKELIDLGKDLDRQTTEGKEAEAALRELFLACGDGELADLFSDGKESGQMEQSGLRIPGRMLWNASRQRGNGRLLGLGKVTLSPNLPRDD